MFLEISTVSKTTRNKVQNVHAAAWTYLNLFGRLGSREPQETDKQGVCPRFFMCVYNQLQNKQIG